MLRNEFRQAVVDLAESVDFPTGARGHVQQITELGAEALYDGEEQIAVEWQTVLSPRQVLDGIRSRDDAESWVLPDALLRRVMERLDAFAAGGRIWQDLDQSYRLRHPPLCVFIVPRALEVPVHRVCIACAAYSSVTPSTKNPNRVRLSANRSARLTSGSMSAPAM